VNAVRAATTRLVSTGLQCPVGRRISGVKTGESPSGNNCLVAGVRFANRKCHNLWSSCIREQETTRAEPEPTTGGPKLRSWRFVVSGRVRMRVTYTSCGVLRECCTKHHKLWKWWKPGNLCDAAASLNDKLDQAVTGRRGRCWDRAKHRCSESEQGSHRAPFAKRPSG
jgi:hypothetical protein